MPMKYTFTLRAQPTFEELIIERGLDTFNRAQGQAPPQELAAFITDDTGAVCGGVMGEVAWGWLYVDLLWLDPAQRHQGQGAALMTSIEQAARDVGARHCWLATTSFQSLPFYQHQGYTLFGELADRPPGHSYYFVQKRDIPAGVAPLPVSDDPDLGHANVVRRGLTAHNAAQGVGSDGERLAVFLEDQDGALHGGIIAATYWGWLDIQAMWVRESLRGQGYGRQLLAHAEAESVKRGCPFACVDVGSFQGLGFFQTCGYTTFGTLQDRPPGHITHFMRKALQG